MITASSVWCYCYSLSAVTFSLSAGFQSQTVVSASSLSKNVSLASINCSRENKSNTVNTTSNGINSTTNQGKHSVPFHRSRLLFFTLLNPFALSAFLFFPPLSLSRVIHRSCYSYSHEIPFDYITLLLFTVVQTFRSLTVPM